jgi:hypothetical protein
MTSDDSVGGTHEMAPERGQWIGGITPELAISGPADARILLGLRCAKRAFYPLLWLGLAGATVWIMVVGNLGPLELEEEVIRLREDGALFAAILSPMAGVALALLWKIGVALAAWVLAYPLTRGSRLDDYQGRSRVGRMRRLWWDRLYWTRAYRALRWTWVVRDAAIDRAGEHARWLTTCEQLIRVSGYALFVAWLVLLVIAL